MVMFILERTRVHFLLEGLSLMQNLHLKMAPYLVRYGIFVSWVVIFVIG